MSYELEKSSGDQFLNPSGGAPLLRGIAEVVSEFEDRPKGREPKAVPEYLAYLSNGSHIVVVRKWLPIDPGWGRVEYGHQDGYFAEVCEVNGNKALPQLNDLSVLQDSFNRVDITDEDGISSYLHPTKFPRLIRERIIRGMSGGNIALPEPGQTPKGVLGQLFDQRDMRENARTVQEASKQAEQDGITAEIIRNYYRSPNRQGYSPKVGNTHVIFSKRPEGGIVGDISRELGLETQVVPEIGPEWEEYRYDNDPMMNYVDSKGRLPLIWTVDHPSYFESPNQPRSIVADRVADRAINFAKEQPVFAFVNAVADTEGGSIGRLPYGFYQAWNLSDRDKLKGLYTKIGIDRLLTDETRKIASNFLR